MDRGRCSMWRRGGQWIKPWDAPIFNSQQEEKGPGKRLLQVPGGGRRLRRVSRQGVQRKPRFPKEGMHVLAFSNFIKVTFPGDVCICVQPWVFPTWNVSISPLHISCFLLHVAIKVCSHCNPPSNPGLQFIGLLCYAALGTNKQV